MIESDLKIGTIILPVEPQYYSPIFIVGATKEGNGYSTPRLIPTVILGQEGIIRHDFYVSLLLEYYHLP